MIPAGISKQTCVLEGSCDYTSLISIKGEAVPVLTKALHNVDIPSSGGMALSFLSSALNGVERSALSAGRFNTTG